MKISILTLFPQMLAGPFEHSILKRAQEKKLVEIELVNIRDFGIGRHKIVDDTPYGGGAGMVLRVDVIDKALQSVTCNLKRKTCNERKVLLDARGERFTQKRATGLVRYDHLILIAGHYEGVDERVRQYLIDETVSIGDYVLTGGEIPAMVIVDSVTRLIPGVIKEESYHHESFSLQTSGKLLLEHPQYTKPQVYKNYSVPQVLLSGNHKEIEKWRQEEALKETKRTRPDLLGPK